MTFSAQKQRGLTFISIVFILGLLAFFVLLGLKIGPIYMNHSKVVTSLSALENMPDVETMTQREIWDNLEKRFGINYVDKVGKEDVTVTKATAYTKVEIEYERVEKLVGNLSVLVEFYESFEAGGE